MQFLSYANSAYMQNPLVCKINLYKIRLYAKSTYMQNPLICKICLNAKSADMQNPLIWKIRLYGKSTYMQNPLICKIHLYKIHLYVKSAYMQEQAWVKRFPTETALKDTHFTSHYVMTCWKIINIVEIIQQNHLSCLYLI